MLTTKELIGHGYDKFWKFKGRYRCVKGSRASKKSKTCALDFIIKMMMYPQANLLVVRKTFRTLKDSCFTELKWAVNRIGANNYWQFRENPMEAVYKPTGQKIFFRGLDDPLKVTSITVDTGVLCWMWIEEAYEVNNEADFDMLDESIRGAVPPGLYKQVTLTLNPWSDKWWGKARFWDAEKDDDILAMTTNYKCNEWLDEADLRVFERMKKNNPRRYRVAGLGEWGVIEGLVYENWVEKTFRMSEIENIPGIKFIYGLDFGYSTDPTAVFMGAIDIPEKVLYVYDEIYMYKASNEKIAQELRKRQITKIVADCAEPKSIARLRELGIYHIKPCRKGKDSISNGIDYLQDFKIIIHPRCINFLREISLYVWDTDKDGKPTGKPVDSDNHLLDAMRYSTGDAARGDIFSFD